MSDAARDGRGSIMSEGKNEAKPSGVVLRMRGALVILGINGYFLSVFGIAVILAIWIKDSLC
jgi:hypothetical protein